MLELDTTIMTLAEVFKTSGHVDRFTDWMTKDIVTGDIFRADHLIEAVLDARLRGDREARGAVVKADVDAEKEKESKSKKKKLKSVAVKLDDETVAEYGSILAQIDNYTGKELAELIVKHNIKAPETGNALSEPVEFNLMFDSNIGPTGQVKG
jgi:glycyl-tRNA synthetase